jgi:signal transduction protein with GAF and PtsI domain
VNPPSDEAARRALDAVRAIALRVEAGTRLAPPTTGLLLRSIVEATAALFDAEASSIALYDPATHRLVFQVAAGSHGEGVVGLAIAPDQGIAGYVYTTGQPLALSDVARDARFGREAAEQTGYVPRSVVAVPLLDDEGSIGVLEVLDKRSAAAFDLRDIELAAVFARQATVAIRASRLAVPHMRKKGGGVIIFITSIWGRESGGRMTYNAVKAAEKEDRAHGL